jgi:hypothetical protein
LADVWETENVLSENLISELDRIARISRYLAIPQGGGMCLYGAKVPTYIDCYLSEAMEEASNTRLKPIISFLRLNSANHDTEFRVHSDTVILGQLPTHASVFYLETSKDSGTAFFEHPVHGCKDPSKSLIFTQDDGLWVPYKKYNAKRNSLLTYRSELFHGRFPWKARGNSRKDGRIVIVKFMEQAL